MPPLPLAGHAGHAGRAQPCRSHTVAHQPCPVARRPCPVPAGCTPSPRRPCPASPATPHRLCRPRLALLPATSAELCPFACHAGRIPAARLRSWEATAMSSSSNSNRRRSIAASSSLFWCAVMNSDEFRADSGKLRDGVFAPTRFGRYTGPP